MLIVSGLIPVLRVVHGEWQGTGFDKIPEFIYIIYLALLYAALLSLSYPSFRKTIINKQKRSRMFGVFIAASVFIWMIVMFLVMGESSRNIF